jgi:hypothetical protein
MRNSSKVLFIDVCIFVITSQKLHIGLDTIIKVKRIGGNMHYG